MVASVLIITFSALLFAYWFRYSCILLLRNRLTSESAADERFQFAVVQARLRTQEALDPLHASLQRDYEVLSYLLRHTAGLELDSFEDRLLVLDYHVMQIWYRLFRTARPGQARRALGEMADVLSVLSHRIGGHGSVPGQA
jgi:hypothetical protein